MRALAASWTKRSAAVSSSGAFWPLNLGGVIFERLGLNLIGLRLEGSNGSAKQVIGTRRIHHQAFGTAGQPEAHGRLSGSRA
jgi:hypothetical protein